MRKIDTIIIHCAATKPSMDIGLDEIDRWHRQRGWKGIGYHYVIRRGGALEKGRDNAEIGAHATGHNKTSLGICLVGGIDERGRSDANYTEGQWKSLEILVRELQKAYGIPNENIIGHNQVAAKACPCFDVPAWVKDVLEK